MKSPTTTFDTIARRYAATTRDCRYSVVLDAMRTDGITIPDRGFKKAIIEAISTIASIREERAARARDVVPSPWWKRRVSYILTQIAKAHDQASPMYAGGTSAKADRGPASVIATRSLVWQKYTSSKSHQVSSLELSVTVPARFIVAVHRGLALSVGGVAHIDAVKISDSLYRVLCATVEKGVRGNPVHLEWQYIAKDGIYWRRGDTTEEAQLNALNAARNAARAADAVRAA